MAATLEELKSAASALSLSERAELAQHLLRTLEPVEEGAADEWLALAEKRMADVRAGRVAGIPATQVLESMRRPRP
ncbi:MAG: addiction module protein [Gemmataceae bacterium]|nr:addiction module protein [Gemmataceae bacterium]